MMLTWQQCIEMAISNFSQEFPDEAIENIAQMQDAIAGIDDQQKMFAIASAANLLEEHGRVTEAIAYYEQLIKLALKNDPEDIRTARDLSLLARLYHQIGSFEQEGKVLEQAGQIYSNLPAWWFGMLEPRELESFNDRLKQSRTLLTLRRNLRQSISTHKEIIGRIAAIVRNGFSRLAAEPQSVVQEIHNGLVPFSESPAVLEVTSVLRSYLLKQKRCWMELLRITGPGAEGWRQRQFVVRTSFPESILRCAALGDGTLVVFSNNKRAWTAQIGKQPREVTLPAIPRAGEYSLQSVGGNLALIDEDRTLWFLRDREGVLTALNIKYQDVLLFTSAGGRYFVLFADGSLASFDEAGTCHGRVQQACAEPGSVYQMLAMDDGNAVWLVQALPGGGLGRSRLWKVYFNPLGVDPGIEIPLAVQGICQSLRSDCLLIGSLEGLREWKISDPFPTHAENGSVGQIIRTSDGHYTAMSWIGVRVMQYEAGLWAKVPLPGATGVVTQLLLDEIRNPPLLHVVIADTIETWEMDKLLWRPMDVGLEGWVEKGIFSDDGSELVAISPAGIRCLWKVESGALVEFENHDPKVRMIAWAPNRSLGAICEEGAVEIFDRDQVEVARILDPRPQGATWSGDGSRLAWAGCFDSCIRWAERTGRGFKEHWIAGKEKTYSLSPSLSPDGKILALIRSKFRIPNLPEEGVSGHIGFPQILSRSPNRAEFADPIVCVDLETGNVLWEVPSMDCWWRSVWWLSNRYLFACDDMWRATILDRDSAKVIASCWTDEPATGGRLIAQYLRLSDTGFSAAVGPVVYDFRVYREGEPLRWE